MCVLWLKCSGKFDLDLYTDTFFFLANTALSLHRLYISNICIISYSLVKIQLKSTKYLYVWLFKNQNSPNFSRYLCPQTVGSIMIAESMYTRLKETINIRICEENQRKSCLNKKNQLCPWVKVILFFIIRSVILWNIVGAKFS